MGAFEQRGRGAIEEGTLPSERDVATTDGGSLVTAMMTHELRTPMSAIVGLSDLLLETPLDPVQKTYTESIRTSASSLLRIIDDILELATIDEKEIALEVKPFDHKAMLHTLLEVVAPTLASRGLSARIEWAVRTPRWVTGDERRVRQVLLNLIANAIKFTPKGVITVRVRASSVERDRCSVRWDVTDTGVGIPPERLDRIFDPFYQVDSSAKRRFGGTGLGLSICRRLVEIQGGTLGVTSVVGEGSTFSLELPFGRSGGHAQATEAPATEVISTRARVLVVEDDRTNQLVARRLLEKLGHEVHVAENGAIAVERVRNETFDLVLMDCMMPDMDGYEATREIRRIEESLERRTPIIALTANAMAGDRERCLASGMDDYLTKPVDRIALAAAIARFVAAPSDAPRGTSLPAR